MNCRQIFRWFPAAVASAALAGVPAAPQVATWAITNVSVVDVEAGRTLPDRAVVIRGDRIASVLPAAAADLPERRVDGSGSFLIPGLWDMHVHLADPMDRDAQFRELVARGILGARALMTPIGSASELHQQAETPGWIGPRLHFAGPGSVQKIVGWEYNGDGSWIVIDDPGLALQHAQEVRDDGMSALKVHDFNSPEVYRALAAAARNTGLELVGHLPTGVSVQAAIDAGHRSMEHLGGLLQPILRECSAPSLPTAGYRDTYLKDGMEAYIRALSQADLDRIISGYDPATCGLVFDQLAAAPVWQVPTLVLFREWAQDGEIVSDWWRPTDADLLQLRRL